MCQESRAVATEEVVAKDFPDEAHFGCKVVFHVPVGWLKNGLKSECVKSVLFWCFEQSHQRYPIPPVACGHISVG